MKNKIIVVIGVLLIFTAMLFAISQDNIAEDKKNAISLVVSFYPLEYLANSIGGERVSVVNLTPPGAEPHDFEASPRDIEMLSRADIFVYNGSGLEPWIFGWTTGSFKHPRFTVNMTEKLETDGNELIKRGNATDPHVWLDPVIMRKEALILRDTLIVADPSYENIYRENTSRLLAELDLLDARYRESLRVCEIRDMVVSHEAFAYLARTYDLSVISIAGISPDEEPSPKTLAYISDLAREKNIKYIFFEAIANPKLSQAIAREIGAETLVLNTLESLTVDELRSGEDYASVMGQNLNNLKKAFVCQ